MNLTDWIGFTGVTILLVAFFLNLRNVIEKDSLAYILMNLIGAAIACVASILLNYMPFIILEGCWTLVSLSGLVNYLNAAPKNSSSLLLRRRERDEVIKRKFFGDATKNKMTPTGQTNLNELLKSMKPKLHPGEYVFCVVEDISSVNPNDIIMTFREDEGDTLIIKKEIADQLHLSYSFVASWITLTVHSSLAAVGLTAAFSKALADEEISCNVVAAFYHDHIFVDQKDAERAMTILTQLSERS
jgi:hypothetical protein